MIKIIDGKRYNTDTATKVAGNWNGLGSSDWHNLNEELYLTKSGAWFLYGSGGPLTRYGKSAGNQSWGSSEIIPLDPQGAYEWCEENDMVDVIEEYFPDRVEEA